MAVSIMLISEFENVNLQSNMMDVADNLSAAKKNEIQHLMHLVQLSPLWLQLCGNYQYFGARKAVAATIVVMKTIMAILWLQLQ
ncbi:hypothetical protein RIF29_19426 [Crotalaria pallida]|uniref:Uncharacterized protein n=1 Tax=Crotalaria pallida TaxID=3830 RepID=A0AAN9I6H9_CROPI